MNEVCLFSLGFLLAVPSVACAYRLLDLAYDARRHFPRALLSASGWLGLHAVVLTLAPNPLVYSYLLGIGGFITFHVVSFLTLRAWALRVFRQPSASRRLADPHPTTGPEPYP